MLLDEHIYWEKEEPNFKGLQLKDILMPISFHSDPVEDRNGYSIEIKGDVVEFSFEPGCLQISVEDAQRISKDEFHRIVSEIAENIEYATGVRFTLSCG